MPPLLGRHSISSHFAVPAPATRYNLQTKGPGGQAPRHGVDSAHRKRGNDAAKEAPLRSPFLSQAFRHNQHRINILNLKDYRSYRDGPLKDQCYRKHLYGLDASLEKLIADLETVAAPTINAIIHHSKLPGHSKPDHEHLLRFLALQMMRTPVAIDKVAHTFAETRANLISSYGGTSPQLERQLSLRPYEAAKIALGHFHDVCQCFAGLHFHLLPNGTPQSFITSDNPAFKYNLYCEIVRDHGMLGASQSGFMLFIPLSPRHLIILYHNETYKCITVYHDLSVTNNLAAVYQLNKMHCPASGSVVSQVL